MHIEFLLNKAKNWGLPNDGILLLVDVDHQQMRVCNISGNSLAKYTVSTARNGLGNTVNSFKTPLGFHEIVERYGAGQSEGTLFKSRRVVDKPDPLNETSDAITTRILRLAGLELGYNDTTYMRNIYIHGTPFESELGKPVSMGCIRMGNHDIVSLFDLLNERKVFCWIGKMQ